MKTVTVLNYGIGNLRSIERSFSRIGVKSIVTSVASDVNDAERILLPGVGNFNACMNAFNDSGLRPSLEKAISDGKPVLGICVGMQMLFKTSEEGGGTAGLGLLKGRVERFPESFDEKPLRVPHVGFSEIELSKSVLFDGLASNPRFYFTHSYRVVGAAKKDSVGVCNYGGTFTAVVQKGCLYGTQFHPEKSHRSGLALLSNFANKG